MEAVMAKNGVLCCCDVGFLPPDNEEEEETLPVPGDKDKHQLVEERWPTKPPQQDQPKDFDLQGPANDQHSPGQVNVNKEDNDIEPVPARILQEHHRLAHLPFTQMRAMAWAGLLPKSFSRMPHPHVHCLPLWKIYQEAMEDQR